MAPKKIGKYELRSELGRGAMGVVYLAYDTLLNREVALKMMIHAEQGSSEHKRRFYREAQSAGSLMHDNIVKVFDLGEDGGVPFIVMEYLPGRDLKELMTEGKLGSYKEILRFWLHICNGLHHAHRRGLIHRDVKPGNIRITTAGRVKIMDFGIAKKPSSDLTQSGVVLGTVDYMAPEQVKGIGADHRSDLFSLGVMFYEMLAGKKPYPGDSVTSVIYKIVYEEPESFEPRVACPPDTVDIIRRLLHKSPEHRYQSAIDVARDLKNSYSAWRSGQMPATSHGALTPSLEHAAQDRSPSVAVPAASLNAAAAPQPQPAAPVSLPMAQPMAPPLLAVSPLARAATMSPSEVPPPSAPAADNPNDFATLLTTRHPTPVSLPPSDDDSTAVSAHVQEEKAPLPHRAPPAVAAVTPPTSYVPPAPGPERGTPQAPVMMSIDDLPMRPAEPPGGIDALHYHPHAALPVSVPQRQAPARAAPTLVEFDIAAVEPARRREAPRGRALPVFWISMALLFLGTLAGLALWVRIEAQRRGPGRGVLPSAAPVVPSPAPTAPPRPPAPTPKGSLRIESNLPGELLVDGAPVAQVPATAPIPIAEGKHHLTLREPRTGAAVEADVEVTAGAEAALPMTFTGTGLVVLHVRPWANVRVDANKDMIEVQSTSKPIPLEAGKHTFTFQKPDKTEVKKEEWVVPGKTVDVWVDSAPLP